MSSCEIKITINNCDLPVIQEPLVIIVLYKINVLGRCVTETTSRAGVVAVTVRVWTQCRPAANQTHFAHRFA